MKTSILTFLETLPYFTIEAVKQLVGNDSGVTGTIPTALYRWMKTGYVYQLKKGVYMTRRFYELHRSDVDFAPAVSAILMPRSYVSLEFILQKHAILTEVTYPVTAVTIKHTRVIENRLGSFVFHNIKEDLYRGFVISDYLGIPFSQASVAKALFDLLYFRPWRSSTNLAEDLRLNLEDFTEKDQFEFAGFVEFSKSKKMEKILKNLRKSIWRL